ncbi:MAG: sulfurtransferase [Streptosporangiaceae bacterium]
MRPLIQVSELAGVLDGPSAPTLLDVRWRLGGPAGIDDYRAGHLPGAVFCDLDRDLAAPPGPAGRHPLPEASAFQDAMRRLGVRGERAVVVYDQGGDAMAAARAWWTLRYFGHGDVGVLDGGYDAWRVAGLPVTTAEPGVDSGDFVARPGGMPLLDADGARDLAGTGVLLDARAPERFRGETEPMDPVAGHIPGAMNAPYAANVGGDGRLRSTEALRERFAAFGATEDRAVGAYCGSGVSAAQEILALTRAGIPAALYVGSWSNWVSDPARPVATGGE